MGFGSIPAGPIEDPLITWNRERRKSKHGDRCVCETAGALECPHHFWFEVQRILALPDDE